MTSEKITKLKDRSMETSNINAKGKNTNNRKRTPKNFGEILKSRYT